MKEKKKYTKKKKMKEKLKRRRKLKRREKGECKVARDLSLLLTQKEEGDKDK